MQSFRIFLLPLSGVHFQTFFDVFGQKLHSSNFKGLVEGINIVLDLGEFLQLIFVLLKSGVSGSKFFGIFGYVILVKPVILLKGVQKVAYFVLGSLDTSCKQQYDFNDFFITSN